MPAPLNHRHNSPRSSGLRLSALLPEKETGDIHHRAAGRRNAVGAAARVGVRSRADLRKTNKRQCDGVFFTLSPAAFTPFKESICWRPRATKHFSEHGRMAPSAEAVFLQDIGTRPSPMPKDDVMAFLVKFVNVIMQDLLSQL